MNGSIVGFIYNEVALGGIKKILNMGMSEFMVGKEVLVSSSRESP